MPPALSIVNAAGDARKSDPTHGKSVRGKVAQSCHSKKSWQNHPFVFVVNTKAATPCLDRWDPRDLSIIVIHRRPSGRSTYSGLDIIEQAVAPRVLDQFVAAVEVQLVH